MIKDFVAIDFETANENFSSICSVGLVFVKDSIITEKIYSLIKPVPNYYRYWNTKVHGITYEDTVNSIEFSDFWARISKKIEGFVLIAHNSSFDKNCLISVHRYYDLYYPNYDFFCTCRQSRKVIGRKLANHKLHTVASYCGFDLKNHHNALADAEACAHIALQIF